MRIEYLSYGKFSKVKPVQRDNVLAYVLVEPMGLVHLFFLGQLLKRMLISLPMFCFAEKKIYVSFVNMFVDAEIMFIIIHIHNICIHIYIMQFQVT